ncbi:MAG: chemotaxis protein CheW [Holophagaceae bacterium]|nr:chemotaxis protein CheW [Holophagaceae bacterium]
MTGPTGCPSSTWPRSRLLPGAEQAAPCRGPWRGSWTPGTGGPGGEPGSDVPAAPGSSKTGTILVLDLAGTATGLLVDAVDAVVSIPDSDLVPASPLLAGLEGAWVEGFIVQGERVVTLLDAALIANQGVGRTQGKRGAGSPQPGGAAR